MNSDVYVALKSAKGNCVAVCGTEAYEVIKAEDGTSYVLIDIVPDSGTVTLTQGNA